jgi:predicted XRE-type DNA-binding protein
MISKESKRPTDGTGNVFADLGIANPEQELAKARLTLMIHRIIFARRLTQVQAAEILGVKQPQVSLLMRNRHGTFSVSRLIDFLTALGQDVQITVRATRKDQGEFSVAPALPDRRGWLPRTWPEVRANA